MRYTECKLRPLAVDLLSEIKQQTVDFRPNYDGQHAEPVVLPAQLPQLLVNGAEGIAVGMATRIPPHNLREIIDAVTLLIDDPDVTGAALCKKVKGPDFPTGGIILNSREELADIYETGQGSVRTRARWTTEKVGRKHFIVVTEVPYATNKAVLVEKIGLLISERKIPQLQDVRDESTDVVRVVLELRQEGDEQAAMAFLFKHTALQTSFPVNLTCLVPAEDSELPAVPMRCSLREMLRYWLDFRITTVRRRFIYELEQLRARIHILDGFARVFDVLDEVIRIIRASEGKRDAAERLMDRFNLDDLQTEAILELRLYKLAKLEILAIQEELGEKRAAALHIEGLLSSERLLQAEVRKELQELRKAYAEPRRTDIGLEGDDPSYDENAYILAEDAYVVVTRDGWVKRQGSFNGVERIRVREGDAVGWIGKGSTRATVTFFTDRGGAYVLRIDDLVSTAGHGEPVQRHFSFADGERVVGVAIHDRASLPEVPEALLDGVPDEAGNIEAPPPHGVAVTRQGRCLRFPLSTHAEVSNKNGRRYVKTDEADDGVISVLISDGTETVCVASTEGRALCFSVTEVSVVKAAGKGVTAIKLDEGDTLLAFELSRDKAVGPTVTTGVGKLEIISPSRFQGARAARGKGVIRSGKLQPWRPNLCRLDLLRPPDEPRDDDRPSPVGRGEE
jgi:DNA gyrase subunit A